MAVAIEVVQGPGRGWRYVLAAAEVRLGRGAGHQVKLDDPSWGGGHLRVQDRQGGYVVTNRMGHTVLIDGRPLADGDQSTWFTGVCVQPTGNTLLRLGPADRPAGAEADGGVIPVPPGDGYTARRKRVNNWIAVGVLAVAAAGLGAKQFLKPKPVSAGHEFVTRVHPALVEAFPAGRGEQVSQAIRKGLVCESKRDAGGAKRKYEEARRLIAELAATNPVDQTPSLALARRFVAVRETELTGG